MAKANQVAYTHPHPSPRHVMVAYRRFILGTKRVKGSARQQHHYRAYINEYLAAKRLIIKKEIPNGR